MSDEESFEEVDSTIIRDLKASLKKPTFHREIRDDGIVVYYFDNLSRAVLIQWIDFVRGLQDKLKEAQRILYDFRGSGPPSRFMIDKLPLLLAEIKIPTGTRSAFLVDDDLNGRFTRNALSGLPVNIGRTNVFLNFSPAIRWLNEELPLDE